MTVVFIDHEHFVILGIVGTVQTQEVKNWLYDSGIDDHWHVGNIIKGVYQPEQRTLLELRFA